MRRAVGSGIASLLFLSAFAIAGGVLTFEERVKAQEAIERVYYEHRIWPEENPGPKPPFEQMITRAQIEDKVEEYLKKLAALDKFWHRPLTAEQIQAEIDRMAKHTKAPDTLRELFAALDNDPYLIAECLARPILADRLIHNWYAYDTRFHRQLKGEAEALHGMITPESFAALGGERYRDVEIEMKEADSREMRDAGSKVRELEEDDFIKVAGEFPVEGKITPVQETMDAFVILWTDRRDERALKGGVIIFPKRSFDAWFNGIEGNLMEPLEFAPATYVLAALPSVLLSGNYWRDTYALNDPLPVARWQHAAVWTGTEMIVWGGNIATTLANTGGRYAPETDIWMAISTGANCPTARSYHTAVWTGTEMIVWGGHDGSVMNTGGRYNPAANSWTATSAGVNCASGRYDHTAVWTGTEMIVWGGVGISPTYKNDGGRYAPGTDTWTVTSTGANCPSGRWKHTAVWTGTEMIVWGGIIEGPSDNTGGRYVPGTDSWTATSTGANCPSGRWEHTAVWTGTEMIIWGGNPTTKTGGRYTPGTDNWTATSTEANCPSGRDRHTAVWTGTEMIVWGGYDGSSAVNTGGRYAPETDTWTATSTGANSPSARHEHTAVWTETEMIVWGGRNGSSYLNTGGRYAPVTESWTATSMEANCPSGRAEHTAVWTGTEMIVWGGSYSSILNTGGRYAPGTDTWTATSTGANCPSGRAEHTAVWTGMEMIVWGGNPYTNSGGRYAPGTDTWTVTSTGASCPSARYGHTAVWTGTIMIVWGGYNGSTAVNTGGRYAPVLDSWTATSTSANCPSARYDHTTVWTGTEMIVWGGRNGSSYFSTGGRYAPGSDTWPATTAGGANCPSSRDRHTAVWTGTEMIVWGGRNGSSYLNSGGRYSPGAGTWTVTSTGAYCPSGRGSHSAVWTGSDMIVWGGYGGNTLNSGGWYMPGTDTWGATSTGANCPSDRSVHTAVWTGTEMIVWGGGSIGYYNTGGIYYPCMPSSALANSSSADLDACGDTGVRTTWATDPADWGDGGMGTRTYDILRDGLAIQTGLPYGTTAFTDTTGVNGTIYSYAVRYINGCGNSAATTGQITMDWVGPSPAVTGPAPACVVAALATQDYSSCQWYRNGSLIPGATSQNYSTVVAGTYTVAVTDSHGCNATSPGFVVWPNPAQPTVTGPDSGCGSVTLMAGAYATYQWTWSMGDIPGATAQSYDATASDTYSVRAANAGGCTATSSGKVVTVFPMPSPSIDGPASGCGSVTLSTSAYASYQWIKDGVDILGATLQTYPVSISGTYKVRVTSVDGCTTTSSGKIVTIYAVPSPAVLGPDSGCGSVTLYTGSFASYQWAMDGVDIAGATEQNYLASAGGTYSVRVTTADGCSNTSSGKVVAIFSFPTPAVTGDNINTCPVVTVTLSTGAFASYQWLYNGSPIPNATAQTYAAGVSGNYSVRVSDVAGCFGTSPEYPVFVDFCAASEVSPAGAIFPLRIMKDPASFTGYYLYFQRLDTLDGYNLYRGTLGTWYSHGGMGSAGCEFPAMDLGTGEMRAEVSPSGGNDYYLVTAFGGGVEGPSGFDSTGLEIEPLQSTCLP